jgi:hypothetical protein
MSKRRAFLAAILAGSISLGAAARAEAGILKKFKRAFWKQLDKGVGWRFGKDAGPTGGVKIEKHRS